ncbi:MAG: hypothetical protein II771_00495, partial [Clostridia bacterium]|nr:hypothetical protein [Clostridia bacterium]
STVDGGKNPPTAVSKSASVTVRSGSHLVIAAFSRQIKNQKLTGTSTVTVEGNAQVDLLYYAPIGVTFDVTAKTVLRVGEHARIGRIVGGTGKGTLDSVTLEWLSGEIGEFSPAGGGAETTAKNGYRLTFSAVSAGEGNFAAVTKLFNDRTQTDYTLPAAIETEPLVFGRKTPRTELSPDEEEPGIPGGDAPQSSAPLSPLLWIIPAAAVVLGAGIFLFLRGRKKS